MNIPDTPEERNAEIEKLQQQINKLIKANEEESTLTLEQRLASYMHSKLCRYDHTDGCAWFYEDWQNRGNGIFSARQKYLIMAKEALKIAPYNAIFDLVNIIRRA